MQHPPRLQAGRRWADAGTASPCLFGVFHADLLLFDYIQYIQRIPPPGQHADNRASVNSTMDYLRQFADAGVAVLVVAAVGRTKDNIGRTSYSGDGLNLASFRESSELEFGADDAFMLVPSEDGAEYGTVTVTLRHLKARHTQPKDLVLEFDRRTQRLAEIESPNAWNPDGGPARDKLQSALHRLWNSTPPAEADEGDRDQGGDE